MSTTERKETKHATEITPADLATVANTEGIAAVTATGNCVTGITLLVKTPASQYAIPPNKITRINAAFPALVGRFATIQRQVYDHTRTETAPVHAVTTAAARLGTMTEKEITDALEAAGVEWHCARYPLVTWVTNDGFRVDKLTGIVTRGLKHPDYRETTSGGRPLGMPATKKAAQRLGRPALPCRMGTLPHDRRKEKRAMDLNAELDATIEAIHREEYEEALANLRRHCSERNARA